MKLKDMKKEDLETLSYNDIANIIVEEQGKQKTIDLFKQIVKLLDLPESAIENKIGDFYTSLTTDQRFTLLSDGTWDLKNNHPTAKIIVEDDEDIEEPTDDEYEDEYEEKDDIYDDSEDISDDVTDEYKNLVIVDEEDLDNLEQ